MAKLNEELRALKTQANTASNSEQKLTEEVDQLRANEQTKSRKLEEARSQLTELQAALEERQRAADEAARQSTESAATIENLQSEMESLRRAASSATSSQDELNNELDSLRAEQNEKTKALEEAHKEVEALKKSLAGRDKALARSEHLLDRARSKAPASRVVPLLIVLIVVLLGAVALLQWQSARQTGAPHTQVLQLAFPAGEPLGTLYTRPDVAGNQTPWNKFGPARGTIKLPATTDLGLRLPEQTAEDLSALAAFASLPQIKALWFEALEINESNLKTLDRFTALEEVSIELGLTAEGRAALAAVLPEDCTLHATLPIAIARQQASTPPPARTVQFPPRTSLGELFVRSWTAPPPADWEDFGHARGAIDVPAAMALKLVVSPQAAADLAALATLRKDDLHTISLVGNRVTNAQIANLRTLTGLRGLDLSYTSVTDRGLDQLRNLDKLTQIWMYDIEMSDNGFMVFDNFQQLEFLKIDGANITNRSLPRIKALKDSLRWLHISETGITREGILELRRHLDNTQITTE